jgi:hypothetical protein
MHKERKMSTKDDQGQEARTGHVSVLHMIADIFDACTAHHDAQGQRLKVVVGAEHESLEEAVRECVRKLK